ncbi:hypothetical protein V6N13_132894 [Hibiscus sabdariffa]
MGTSEPLPRTLPVLKSSPVCESEVRKRTCSMDFGCFSSYPLVFGRFLPIVNMFEKYECFGQEHEAETYR